jgi:hypothetical protein
MNKGRSVIWIGVVLVLLSGCRAGRNVLRTEKQTTEHSEEVSGRIEEVKRYSSSLKLRKAEVQYEINGEEEAVTSSIGIIRDSIIIISVVPVAGIEVLRIYCTPDSITLINRSDKTYSHSGISRIQDKYGINISYADIQSILSNELFLYGFTEGSEYQLDEHEGESLDGIIEYRMMYKEEENVWQQVHFDRKDLYIKRISITDFKRKLLIDILYGDFLLINGIMFPGKLSLKIDDPQNKISMSIRTERIEFNEDVRIRRSLPDGYRRMEL